MGNKRLMGINVVSLFPWSMGSHGAKRALRIAQEAGYDGLQILPLRGWNQNPFIPKEAVISYEDAWNTGSLFGVIQRTTGMAGEEKPTLKDWLLFGNRRKVDKRLDIFKKLFPNAMFVGHHPGDLLEIHPEADLIQSQYRNYRFGLVWDTYHVVRPARDGIGAPVAKDWEKFLNSLNPKQIKLIHFHSEGRELQDFLGYKENQISRMLKALKYVDCPIIVEVPPLSPALFPVNIVRYLMEIRNLILNCIDAY